MGQHQRDLEALALWADWGAKLAGSAGDLDAVLAGVGTPRITAKKPPNRILLRLSHHADSGQLRVELRVNFTGVPQAEMEFRGAVYRESARVETDTTSEWGHLTFARKHVEVSWVHEGVTKVLDAVLSRSPFMAAEAALLVEFARITNLGIGVDAKLGTVSMVVFSPRYGIDQRPTYERMGFALTRGDGTPFSPLDEEMWEADHGPNHPWPRDVLWRNARGDEIDGQYARFGGRAARILW